MAHSNTGGPEVTYLRRHMKLVLVAAACVTIGAAGSAIATAGAAGTPQAPATTSAKFPRGRALLARRAVHAEVVVATRTGFATVTIDRGFVQSVNGRQLTVREGTKKSTYRTVTLTIPAGAEVRDNGRGASLSALTPGQRVGVVQGPHATRVTARDVTG